MNEMDNRQLFIEGLKNATKEELEERLTRAFDSTHMGIQISKMHMGVPAMVCNLLSTIKDLKGIKGEPF